jgi:hypothetical protein
MFYLTNNPRPCYTQVTKKSGGKKIRLYFFDFYGKALTMLIIGKEKLILFDPEIATVISILFIDFKLCPRSIGKTEVSGVSLMDVGTGAVLFTSGASARQIRCNHYY